MRNRLAVFTVVAAAAFVLSHAPIGASQNASAGGKTTWSGVYSAGQATKGEALYNDKCVRCHGANGAGADAPALVGKDFATDWDGLTVDQLFDRIRSSMPQDDPGSLSPEGTATLLAYIFQKNGFPAADGDLSGENALLHGIMYKAAKP
jgi:mono/diheme cytochrome c family protein